jgi:hypothetical protein
MYQVDEITFDFEGEDITEEEQQSIIEETKSYLWDTTETDLKSLIFNEMGYSVLDVKVTSK